MKRFDAIKESVRDYRAYIRNMWAYYDECLTFRRGVVSDRDVAFNTIDRLIDDSEVSNAFLADRFVDFMLDFTMREAGGRFENLLINADMKRPGLEELVYKKAKAKREANDAKMKQG